MNKYNREVAELIDQLRTPKDRQMFFEGAQIPVHLVYDSEDRETQAVVQEVSFESLLRKPKGKQLNRVKRSDMTNLEKHTVIDLVTSEKNANKVASMGHKIMTITPENDEIGDEQLPVDNLNEELEIESRHEHKINSNISPAIQKSSPMDYNYNTIKDMIKNINNYGKNSGVRRTIQHYQSMLQSVKTPPITNLPLEPPPIHNIYESKPKVMKVVSYYPVIPNVPLPPTQDKFTNNEKILDDYFPFVVHNPFNAMWSAMTNIVEYGPEADKCKTEMKTKRKKRDILDEHIEIPQSLLDDLARHNPGFGLVRPNIMKLKVRRGGVAIAGPGGIATAGSGGTTIVGPGGTALTPPDATAIVGPGGRVVHIPSFDSPEFKSKSSDFSQILKNAKVVAHGPIVLYHPPPGVEKY